MVSNDFDLENIDYEKYEVLSKTEVALKEGVTERTIENRIKSEVYRAFGEGKALRILYPKKQNASKPSEFITKPISEHIESPSKDSETEIERLRKENETLRSQVIQLTETITKRDDSFSNLSNQLQNAHNALQKRNLPAELDPGERVKQLENQILELMRLQAESIKTQSKNKTFWQKVKDVFK